MQSNFDDKSAVTGIQWLDEVEMRAWRGMLSAHSHVYSQLDEELYRAHGITFAEYEVLVHTSEGPGGSIRMSNLAEAALVSRSGLTRRVQHLVAVGLLERRRCKEDKRGTFAVLTPLGWEKLRAAAATHIKGVREHVISKLSRADLEILASAFDKVVEPNDFEGR
ncbi:MAG: MarR family winged helix-turn-helix transcriptional regulator [Actinomycetota bacterium]|jgi:DNA-binding MarR family transcriptional regulator|nr:MarR family winged helix-turn-helix transcriptional regulator [Actinomycetota bacterium]